MTSLPLVFLLLALTSTQLPASILLDVDGNEHVLPDPDAKATRIPLHSRGPHCYDDRAAR